MGVAVGVVGVVVGCRAVGSAAELGLGGTLGLEPPHGLRCHPGATPGMPYVRRAGFEKLRRHARAPPRAALREMRPLAVGQGEVEVAESRMCIFKKQMYIGFCSKPSKKISPSKPTKKPGTYK